MPPDEHHRTEPSAAPLVDTGWLEQRLDDPALRIVDATVQIKMWPFPRIRSGRRGWKKAHIPGAVFSDLRRLADPATPTHAFALPSAERFAEAMGRLGIGPGARVVLYDARENMWAARLWWLLRLFGFDQASVLDGGWTAWSRENRPTCSKPCSYPPATFEPRPRPDLLVNKEQVLEAIDDPHTCIVSALGRRQHRGERNEYRRRGHIPSARNVTAWEILERETQRYRPVDELKERFGDILETDRVITYCGAGIAAASAALALHTLGHRNVAVYDGGLVEWCADRTLPLAIGEMR